MALKIMDLFKSIKWAKNGDVTDMSQTNYEAGWSHLGDDTPTVEDFNLVQKLNDEKDQWLFNQIKAVCDAKGIAITETDKQALLKAINTSATLSMAGITQLSSAIDSTIENMAATPKAIKTLKDLIDAITRNLGNYIPNSKKSNAVNSNSADTVATSVAVKIAYDLANSKQSPSNTLAGYGITDFKVQSANGNLNTFRTDGVYCFGSIYNSENIPNGNSGNLQVITGGRGNERWCKQIFHEHYTGQVFSRWQLDVSNDNWSPWLKITQSISVIKGIINNGAVLPLPAGYSENQCHWIVSMSEDVSLDRIENTNTGYTKSECYVDGNRRVVARVYSKAGANLDSTTGKKFDNSRANYLVIGVK